MSDPWTTADECLWLDTIGRTYEKTREMDEAVLLARYLESAARRRNWGHLNRQTVLRHATQRHAQLMAARGAAA
jgi:hypothetical protein